MKIAFASPSYRRPKCLTARYIPQTRIYVDPGEVEAYEAANAGYGEVVACAPGVQGNLPRVRNHILEREFGGGADAVVMMDDDVQNLAEFKPDGSGFGYSRHIIPGDEVPRFVEYGSRIALEWGLGMWGVNYNMNKMLYKHFLPFRTTKCAVGQFMVFVRNDLRFDEGLPLKEDYDMALQQMQRYRGVLILEWVHVTADMGKTEGGTSVRRNFEREHEQFLKFRRKWGSDIVTGTNRVKGCGKTHVNGEYTYGYDFSHPIVRCPIKGV